MIVQMKNNVRKLSQKAAEHSNAISALQYSQAATNIANALVALVSNQIIDKNDKGDTAAQKLLPPPAVQISAPTVLYGE